MAIKRYTADADTTIVNAFQSNLKTRGTGSNAGGADVLETFSIYDRQATGSQELSRILIKFPIDDITSDRTAGTIPASGSVSFYIRMYNAKHSKTVPEDYKLVVAAVSQAWQEGVGLDLETYKDLTYGNTGANWMSASNTALWTSVGGDYITSSEYVYEKTFSTGLEDLEINISHLVEKWIAGTQTNYGVGVHLSASYESYFSQSSGRNSGSVVFNADGATKSYYTKRFFGRNSQYFFKRPTIEARWNDAVRDDRGDFYYSSSLAPAADNLNTLYLYNYVRGTLVNIPDLAPAGKILVSLFSGSTENTVPSGSKLVLHDGNTNVTGGWVSTGIYSASVCATASAAPLTELFDVWHTGSTSGDRALVGGTVFATGSITPSKIIGGMAAAKPTYYLNITNLRGSYRKDETARFNLYIRNKYWNPTIYTVATTTPISTTIVSASYRVFRVIDGYDAIQYGTGSDEHTYLSYHISGNYFDFDMSLLESGYSYAFKFAFYDNGLSSWVEQPYVFKFRVEDYEY